jgi:type VI secretion system secreted protein VgrG
LTLDSLGNPDALFVFQIGSGLTTASAASVLNINGGNDCNIFWQVGSSATLGTSTSFKGNILADQSITLTTGATILSGRALALNGAVTLDTNQISIDGCPVVDAPAGTFAPLPTGNAVPEPGGLLMFAVAGAPLCGALLRRRRPA